MKLLSRIFGILLGLALSGRLVAQPVTITPITPHNEVNWGTALQFTQDPQGYLWFVSDRALFRYDGYQVTTSVYNVLAPPQTRLETVYTDANGILWIGTWQGLDRFDPATATLTRFAHVAGDSTSLGHNRVTTLLEDHEGNFWVGTHGGLDLLDRATGTFQHFRHQPDDSTSLSNDQVRVLYEDRSGTLWVGTGSYWSGDTPLGAGGLNRFERATNRFTRFLHDPSDSTSLIDNRIGALLEDSRGTFWVGTFGDGLHTMDRERGTFTRLRYDPAQPHHLSRPYEQFGTTALSVLKVGESGITFLQEDGSGALWIGALLGGVNRYDPATQRTTHYEHNYNAIRGQGLQDRYLWTGYVTRDGTLFMGASGNAFYRVNPFQVSFPFHSTPFPVNAIVAPPDSTLWIHTLYAGLVRRDQKTGQEQRFRHQADQKQSLSNDSLSVLYLDRSGTLWIGTLGSGLDRFEKRTQAFVHHPYLPDDTTTLGGDSVYALFEDRQGRLWVGTQRGPNRLDAETGQFARYTTKTRARSHAFAEDRAGQLWVCTLGDGLGYWEETAQNFVYYRHYPQDSTSLSSDSVYTAYEDRQGRLWVGTRNGLNRLDRASGKFTHYPTPDYISAIKEDASGILWLASRRAKQIMGSLYRFDPASETLTALTNQGTGQPFRDVYAVEQDDEGHIWFCTAAGFAKVDTRQNVVTTYPTQRTTGYYNFYKSPDHQLIAGTGTGYYTFVPEEIPRNTTPPQLALGFQLPISDDSVATAQAFRQALTAQIPISLKHDQNSFMFQVTSLHYNNPEQNEHLYQLEGYDAAWHRVGIDRTVSYHFLPPGRYRFRAKVSSSDGIWTEQSVPLVIRPPWWKTWWAYGLYGLLAIALYGVMFRVITNRERMKADLRVQQVEYDKLRELDTAKSRFFTNISHEFRTPLTLIGGTLEQLMLQEPDAEERQADYRIINHHTNRILQLINQLLDLAKLEAGSLTTETRPVEIQGVLKMLAGSFVSLAEGRGIVYRYSLPEFQHWVMLDSDKLEKIVTNLLSNAFKFTSVGGQVVLTAQLELTGPAQSLLQVSVADTGVGIPPEQLARIFDRFYQVDASSTRSYEGAGIGLALTRELLELLSGQIAVESAPGEGTTFRVTLPLANAPVAGEVLPDGDRIPTRHTVHATPPALPPPVVAEGASAHMLVVEDNPDLRQFLTRNLSKRWQVIEAPDGNTGLQYALELIPDLVVADVMMPGMNGYELCHALKQDERTSHIPVILLTARADLESKLEGLDTGADDYLTKPFKLEELELRIRNLLEQRRLLRERFSKRVTLEPTEETITSIDEQFLQKALALVEENMSNTEFDVETFGQEIGMSRSNLHRKLTALTGQSTSEFIRTLRLKKAASLLRQQGGNISEISMLVGFNSQSYFTKRFREHFGKTPSEFMEE
ncbi:Two component regulator propeller [Catalinimonas alkaloidigena]|uniref:histidine kinase n=1 Tax=Catalinimonas alkaloidigena TaxID=1075417 RepID=A0A1G9AU35_9BACT|nr:two-component regulator propeller domain-containing protein [Catalinimonas alkaloidigena]SDK30849.1 Two component regulator propeller [Catalinimonas alkaloidigena]